MSLHLTRRPRTDDELHAVVRTLFGYTIPRHKVCDDHDAPFDAFSTAYFRKEPQILIRGSRGLAGKSRLLSVLGLTFAVVDGAEATILGGSLAQSQNVHETIRSVIDYKGFDKNWLAAPPTNSLIQFTNGARLRPLTASQRTVRGPHPPVLLGDELDEMDPEIWESAKGQPMDQKNYQGELLEAITAAASTLQYADKTMAREMKRFEEQGLPVFNWCMAESGNPIDGWLSESQIERKKREVSAERWRVEYCGAYYMVVTTNRGDIPLEQVFPGDQVMTRKGWREVLAKWDNGVRELVRVTLDDGRWFDVTPNHRVMSEHGWVAAGSLCEGDAVLAGVHPGSLAVQAGPVAAPVDLHSLGQVSMLAATAAAVDDEAVAVDDVLGAGHQLQVLRVDALVHTAAVVDRQALRDRPDMDDVADPVRQVLTGHDLQSRPGAVPRGTARLAGGVGLEPDPAAIVVDGAALLDAATDARMVGVAQCSVALGAVTTPPVAVGPGEGVATGAGSGVRHVASVSHIGANQVYDLTVAGEHEYYFANGVLNHNCLGEPSIENRAFNSDAIEQMFTQEVGDPNDYTIKNGRDWQEYHFEDVRDDREYVIAADWAKEQDWTVISVCDVTYEPMRVVHWVRMHRHAWPVMTKQYNDLMKRYRCTEAIHDGTGVGNMVSDYIDGRAQAFIMSGHQRSEMLNDYVAAVENGKVIAPRVPDFYRAHLFCVTGDLFSSAKEFHLPDEVCSMALAWRLADRRAPAAINFEVLAREADAVSGFERSIASGKDPIRAQIPELAKGSEKPVEISFTG